LKQGSKDEKYLTGLFEKQKYIEFSELAGSLDRAGRIMAYLALLFLPQKRRYGLSRKSFSGSFYPQAGCAMTGDKEILEAALFASGEPLDIAQLSNLVKGRNARELLGSLMEEYRQRGSALEIKEIEGRFVMQVMPEYADKVRSLAPKELRAPVLRRCP